MGYTHNWDWIKENEEVRIFHIKEKVQRDIEIIIERHKNVLEDKYTLDGGLLMIEGNPAYETLYIEAGVSGFCKTNRNPYDIAVCEILLVFKHYYGELFELTSDGFWVSSEDFWVSHEDRTSGTLGGSWNKALRNIKDVFGYTYDLIPIIDGNYYKFDIKSTVIDVALP